MKAIEAGIHGLRLNPGNIRKAEDVREVVKKAKERGVPMRIGVNYGSVAPMTPEFVDEMAQQNATQVELRAEWMVRSALGHIKILEDLDYGDIKVSLKAFEVPVMLEAYRRFAALPCACVGEVRSEALLTVRGTSGRPLFELPLEELRRAFQGAFQG